MKKRFLLLGLVFFISVALSACGEDEDKKEEKTTEVAEAAVVEEPTAEPEIVINIDEPEEPAAEEPEEVEGDSEGTKITEEYIYGKIAKQYIDIITSINGDEHYFNLVYVRDTKYPQLAIGNQEDGMILYEQQVQLYQADEDGNVERIADFGEIMDSNGPAWYYEGQDTVVLFFSYYGDDDFENVWHICHADGTEIVETQSEDEFSQYAQGLQKHFSEDVYTKEEILDYLNNISSINESVAVQNEEPWKTAYRNYLYDVMSHVEMLSSWYEAYYASEDAIFTFQDITDDGIPELWIADHPFEGDISSWYWCDVLSADSNGELISLGAEDAVYYYDPEQKKLFSHDGGYAEDYTVFRNEKGEFLEDYSLWYDLEPTMERSSDEWTVISMDEYESLLNEFEDGKEKYMLTTGVQLTAENIEQELSKF
ncbi:MAG: hypothetical protein K5770_02375 [Lachnospiraceae bacterium]|nr:hypothetical protein [Lachnospiraceae bacterium]